MIEICKVMIDSFTMLDTVLSALKEFGDYSLEGEGSLEKTI
jgi:hypothetical protein